MKRIFIKTDAVGDLADYASIPSRFSTHSVFDVSADGLTERALTSPLVKDYDALERPETWPRLFDVSRWARLSAYIDGARVGGAIVARDTPGVDLLESWRDLLVLWDIRIHPQTRGMGVGRALFEAAGNWGAECGCIEMKVETQNVNIAACRFYQAMGCTLTDVNRGTYADVPDDIQLFWRKSIAANNGI